MKYKGRGGEKTIFKKPSLIRVKVSYKEIVKEVNNPDNKKLDTFYSIPFKILKEAFGITLLWNNETVEAKFVLDQLKIADINPTFKKSEPALAKNYKSLSILEFVSIIFERII